MIRGMKQAEGRNNRTEGNEADKDKGMTEQEGTDDNPPLCGHVIS
jgi:hypothetical protein